MSDVIYLYIELPRFTFGQNFAESHGENVDGTGKIFAPDLKPKMKKTILKFLTCDAILFITLGDITIKVHKEAQSRWTVLNPPIKPKMVRL